MDYTANQHQSTFYDLDLIFNIMLIIIAFAINCVKQWACAPLLVCPTAQGGHGAGTAAFGGGWQLPQT